MHLQEGALRVTLEFLAKIGNDQQSQPKSELDGPRTFCTTHRQTRDQHRSIDQNLDYSKKIRRTKTNNRIARKSRKCVKKSRSGPVPLGAGGKPSTRFPPGGLVEHLVVTPRLQWTHTWRRLALRKIKNWARLSNPGNPRPNCEKAWKTLQKWRKWKIGHQLPTLSAQ